MLTCALTFGPAATESICWILRPMLLIDPDEPSHGFLQTNRIKAKRYRNFRRSLGVWAQVRLLSRFSVVRLCPR